jgi:hypothetical protein
VNELGAFDAPRDAAGGAAATFSALHGLLVTIVSAVQWTIALWWLFAILAGLWTIYRVRTAVLSLVILFRQGVL